MMNCDDQEKRYIMIRYRESVVGVNRCNIYTETSLGSSTAESVGCSVGLRYRPDKEYKVGWYRVFTPLFAGFFL